MIALEAEQAVLGIVLSDADLVDRVTQLRPAHFSEPVHGYIWSLILEDRRAGKMPTAPTLAPRGGQALEELGGITYLASLIEKSPWHSCLSDSAAAVINAWQMRELMAVAGEVTRGTDALKAVDALKGELQRIEQAAGAVDEAVDASNAAADHLTHLYDQVASGKPAGLMTGLKCIDDRLGGLKPGQVIVTGGRPSMGKTAFSRNVAFGAARYNPDHRVVFYALEMTRQEMAERCLSQLSFEAGWSVAYKDVANPTRESLDRVSRVAGDMPRNLIINDCSRMTVDDVRRDAFRQKSRGQLALIVVDYVQLLSLPDMRGKSDAKIIAEMTAEFKRMAGELGCTIMLVAQLNRNLEGRDNKRPQMSDLRDSGGFEQDANAIFFPYREVVYLRNNPPSDPGKYLEWEDQCAALSHKMVVICAKNRGGEIGDDEMWASMAHDVILNDRPENWRGA